MKAIKYSVLLLLLKYAVGCFCLKSIASFVTTVILFCKECLFVTQLLDARYMAGTGPGADEPVVKETDQIFVILELDTLVEVTSILQMISQVNASINKC